MNKSALLLIAALALSACDSTPDNGFKNPNQATPESTQTTMSAQNISPDQAFLIENQKKTDVHTTASGLQYTIVQEGTGKQPKATDTVSVEYTGKLINGTVFDSTDNHGGQPISFPLNQVIPGWTEGVQLMKEGAHYTFFIPSELAYGQQGAGGVIPPNATLIFDVKLVKVQ